MKGALVVVLVFLVCLIVVVLYIFLGRSQMVKTTADLREQDVALQAQLDEIRAKEKAIPALMARLPLWSRQLSMFEQSIPSEIDDHIFFANLAAEVAKRDVKIMRLETSVGESWLGQITEEMEAELTALGINVNAARGVRLAFYQVTLSGDYDDILNVFESLKRYNRLYTLDLVSGPATSGETASNETVDLDQTPLTFAGKLYYGMSSEEVSRETLTHVFGKAIAGPAARNLFTGVRNAAKDVPAPPAEPPAADGAGGQASAADIFGRELAAALPGGQAQRHLEGWKK